MRKLPTTSAMPAKISRNVLMKRDRLDQVAGGVLGRLVAGDRLVAVGQHGRDVVAQLLLTDPVGGVTQASLKTSLPSRKYFWAVAVSKIVMLAPLVEPPSPKAARPTSVGVMLGSAPEVTSWTVSPTA